MGTPVRVRWTNVPNNSFGWTQASRSGRHINITVCRRLKPRGGRIRTTTADERRDALMHEWAHAMRWVPDEHHCVTTHDAIWGVCLSQVYSAVIED
jgi:hypothetical protein